MSKFIEVALTSGKTTVLNTDCIAAIVEAEKEHHTSLKNDERYSRDLKSVIFMSNCVPEETGMLLSIQSYESLKHILL